MTCQESSDGYCIAHLCAEWKQCRKLSCPHCTELYIGGGDAHYRPLNSTASTRTAPTYNHTRGDTELTPCPKCRSQAFLISNPTGYKGPIYEAYHAAPYVNPVWVEHSRAEALWWRFCDWAVIRMALADKGMTVDSRRTVFVGLSMVGMTAAVVAVLMHLFRRL